MLSISASKTVCSLPEQGFSTILKKVEELKKNGHSVLNFSQGNPDLPTPSHIVRALQKAANQVDFHKYSPFRGYQFFKESIASYYKREYGVDVDPETEIAIFSGGKTALYVISQCLLNKGDIALIPNPGYPEYLSGIIMSEAIPYSYNLFKEKDYVLDYRDIDVDIANKSKLIFLNYPSNPTGSTADISFFEKTVEFAKEFNVFVVHDFAYGAFELGNKKNISFLEAKDAKNVGLEIYSLSKTYNMAGWRVAFAIGNKKIINIINQFQDHIFVSLFGAIQYAAATALNESQSCVRELNEIYKKRIEFFINLSKRKLGWNIQKPKGSFYVWAPVPNNFTSYEFSNYLLENAHIAVTPGELFGSNGKHYVRLSMTNNFNEIEEFVDRISKLNLEFK